MQVEKIKEEKPPKRKILCPYSSDVCFFIIIKLTRKSIYKLTTNIICKYIKSISKLTITSI